MDFDGKVAFITGAATGIGQATAHAFAQRGAAVVVVDINPTGRDVVEDIIAKGGKALFARTDITRSGAIKQLVDKVEQQLGGVDILVNNAATFIEGSVVDVSEEDWCTVLDTNLKGAFLCAKYCIPMMEERGGGVIINIASVKGMAAEKNNAAYAASKGGMIALNRSMALDLASKNIRVNCVCPGAIITDRVKMQIAEYPDPDSIYQEYNDLHALRRMGEPEEVAEVIVFLASSGSSFITGTSVLVDGGMLASFGMAGKPVV